MAVVALCDELIGPLHPEAVAVIILVPVHKALKVTLPVAGSMLFPPKILAASSEYVIPVL